MPYKAAEPTTTESKMKELAERMGFEPTCRLPDNTLSRRARYDHFGTSPSDGIRVAGPTSIAYAVLRVLGSVDRTDASLVG